MSTQKPITIPYRLNSLPQKNEKGFDSTSKRFTYQISLKQQQQLLENYLKQEQNLSEDDAQSLSEKWQFQNQKTQNLDHLQQGDISYKQQKLQSKYQQISEVQKKQQQKNFQYIIPQYKGNLLGLKQQIEQEQKESPQKNSQFNTKDTYKQSQKNKQLKLFQKGHKYFKSLSKSQNPQIFQEDLNKTTKDTSDSESYNNKTQQQYTPSKNNIVQINSQLLKEQQIWNRSYLINNNNNSNQKYNKTENDTHQISAFKKYEENSGYQFSKIKINIKKKDENNDLLVKSFYNDKANKSIQNKTKAQSFHYNKSNNTNYNNNNLKLHKRSTSMYQQEQDIDSYLNIKNCYDKIDEPISNKFTAQSVFKNQPRDKFYEYQNRPIYEKPGPGEYDKDKTEYDLSKAKNIKLYKNDKEKTQKELQKIRSYYKEPIQQLKEQIPEVMQRLTNKDDNIQNLTNYINTNNKNSNFQKNQENNPDYYVKPSDFDKFNPKLNKISNDHMFIESDQDRFGRQLFPIANQNITPPVGLYNQELNTIQSKQQVIKEKQIAQQLLKQYLKKAI